MTRLLAHGCALVVALGTPLLSGCEPTQASDGALVTPTPTVQDFGSVMAGTEVQHTFELRNPLDRAVRILDVRSSCGCGVSPELPRLIPPRSSVPVPVSLDTREKSGPIEVRFRLACDAPELARPSFLLRGEVIPLIRFEPPSLDFGPLELGQSRERMVTVRFAEPVDTVLDWSSPDPHITAEWTTPNRESQGPDDSERMIQRQLRVRVDETLPAGWRVALALELRSAKDPRNAVRLPITARCAAALRLLPTGRHEVTVDSQGRWTSAQLRVQAAEGADVDFHDLELSLRDASPERELSFSWEPRVAPNGVEALLSIEVPGGATVPAFIEVRSESPRGTERTSALLVAAPRPGAGP